MLSGTTKHDFEWFQGALECRWWSAMEKLLYAFAMDCAIVFRQLLFPPRSDYSWFANRQAKAELQGLTHIVLNELGVSFRVHKERCGFCWHQQGANAIAHLHAPACQRSHVRVQVVRDLA